MIDALNEAVTGAIYQQMRLEVLSNNMANINTIGFKKDNIVFHTDFESMETDGTVLPAENTGNLWKFCRFGSCQNIH